MFLTKLKIVACILFLMIVLRTGGLAHQWKYIQSILPENESTPSRLDALRNEMEALQALPAGKTESKIGAATAKVEEQKTTNPPSAARLDQDGTVLPRGALARLGSLRFRNEDGVGGLAYTPDGNILAVAGREGKRQEREVPNTVLMDAVTGKERNRFPGGYAVAIAPDGKSLAFIGKDAVCMQDFATGKLLWQRETYTKKYLEPCRLMYSSDSKNLAVMEAFDAYLLDAASGNLIWHHREASYRLDWPGCAVAFAPDGKTLACAWMGQDWIKGKGRNVKMQMWEASSGKQRWQHETIMDGFFALIYTPDNKALVVSASKVDGRGIWLWDAKTGEEIRQIVSLQDKQAHPGRTALSPDGKTLACLGTSLSSWDMASSKLRWQKKFAPGYAPNSTFTFAPDGKTLALANRFEGVVHLVEASSGKDIPQDLGHEIGILTIAYSRDSRTVFTAGRDGAVRQWEVASGRQLANARLSKALEITDKSGVQVAIAPDGKTIAICTRLPKNLARVEMWDAIIGKRLWRQECFCWRLAYAPDGKTVIATGMDRSIPKKRKWVVETFEAASGKQLWKTDLEDATQFGGKGNYETLAQATYIGGSKTAAVLPPMPTSPLYILDVMTGEVLRKLPSYNEKGFQVRKKLIGTADGRFLAEIISRRPMKLRKTDWQHILFLWDTANGRKIGQFLLPKEDNRELGQTSFAIAPDGWTLAYGDQQSIHFWDVAAGRESHRFQVPSDRKSGVVLAYAPDGRSLAATCGTAPGTALVWDLVGHEKLVGPTSREPNPRQLADLWNDLAGSDAWRAERAIWSLADAPAASIPFLRDKLRSVVPPDLSGLRQLIADLDANAFADRERATQEIKKLGEPAVPALRRALGDRRSLEARRRIEALVNELENVLPIKSVKVLQEHRAIRALERAGKGEARQCLRKLAAGTPGAIQTREAEAALRRLAAHDAKP